MGVLSGQRVVVTRAAHQAEELAAPLREQGADVILLPMLAIGPPHDPAALEQAARDLGSFDWLAFTSTNAVRAFAAALPPSFDRKAVRVAAVGPATRNAAERAGFVVSLAPSTYESAALAEEIGKRLGTVPTRVLMPASELSRNTVPAELRAQGFDVTVVEAYRNICPLEAGEQAVRIFKPPLPDWVLFASPSAVQNLLSFVSAKSLSECKLGSIGHTTSEAIRAAGLQVTAQANPQTVAGLVEAVAKAHRLE